MESKASSSQKSSAPTDVGKAVWSIETRRLVVVGLIAGILLLVYWVRDTLDSLIIAGLLAYLMNPLVSRLARAARLPRIAAAAVVYLALIAILITASFTLIPIFARQAASVGSGFNELLNRIGATVAQYPQLAALGIDAATISANIQRELTALGARVPSLLLGAASSVFSLIFVLVMSFYLVKDADRFEQSVVNSMQLEYRDDAQRIMGELNEIWSSFLRGQVILALIIGGITTVVLWGLGVRNALLLGLLAGILEVVPTIGPIIAMIPAVLVALLQGSANWAIDPTLFALIVVVAYLLIQQLENHLIVPNVLGQSVNLPPVVILFGAFAGASLAGILGIFLAAPVLATARVFLSFVARKLFEPMQSA